MNSGSPKLFADILQGSAGSEPNDYIEFKNELYFGADDGTHGYELWKVAPEVPVSLDKTVKVRILGKKLKMNRSGKVKLRLKCPASEVSGPCRGKVVIKTRSKVKTGSKRRRVTLAGHGFKVPAGVTRKVTLRLNKGARRLVRSSRKARKVVAKATVKDGAGNRRNVTKRMKLRVA
ncbi:MAG: hypothetical protein IPK93_02810 [Solirubrobacterales bacterium]|nr:hypothetical protein [Solirubrobacterales bacterium]